jgi:hypothetical protein
MLVFKHVRLFSSNKPVIHSRELRQNQFFRCEILNESASPIVLWFRNLHHIFYQLKTITTMRVEFDGLLSTILLKIWVSLFFCETSKMSTLIAIYMYATALGIPLQNYKPSLLDFVGHRLIFHISHSFWLRYLWVIEDYRLFSRPIHRILCYAYTYSTIIFIKSLASGQRSVA